MMKATIKHVASFSLMMLLTVGFAVSTHAQNTLYGDNVVIDGDFSGDTLSAKWVVEGTVGTASVTDGELAFTNMSETTNQYDFQVNQPFSAEQIAELAKGGTFELTFDARTTAESKNFHVFLGEVGGSWARYWESPGNGDVTVSNTTQSYTLTTDIKETWAAMRLGFEVSTDTSSLYIDNVVLRKVDDNILYDGELVIGEDSLSTAWNPVSDGNQATYSIDNGAVKISEFRGLVNSYDVQFIQELDAEQVAAIVAGPYEMIFDARTIAEEKSIQVFFGNNGTDGDWTNFAPQVTLDNTMKTYKLAIPATGNWTSMKVGFEVSGDTSTVWFDNVILRRVTEVTPDAPTFNLATANGIVGISVDAQEGAADYDVYFNTEAIDSVDQAGNLLVGTLNSDTGLSVNHTTTAPHPSLVETFTAHYAVVAKTEKGTSSELTASSISTDMSVAPNYAVELSTEDAGTVYEAFGTKVIPEASALAALFPDGYQPFEINEDRRVRETGTGGLTDDDISAKYWIGFDPTTNFMIVYAEVTDDIISLANSVANGSGGAWNFDSWEMGIGNYTPDSFVTGSTHNDFEGGANPDWQLRAGMFADRNPFIHAAGQLADRLDAEISNSETIGDTTDTGYRLLSVIDMAQLSGGVTNDAAFDFPSGDEMNLYPFQLTMNDNDATSRDAQWGWSLAGGQDDWWNTPARWTVVAFVGLNQTYEVSTVSNEEDVDSNPISFKLDQNYPNPFNPTTNISFTLANSGSVTLEVFNMLGQKVATLLQNENLSVGEHTQNFNASSLSSGMYVYRLSTSNFVQSRKMMLIK